MIRPRLASVSGLPDAPTMRLAFVGRPTLWIDVALRSRPAAGERFTMRLALRFAAEELAVMTRVQLGLLYSAAKPGEPWPVPDDGAVVATIRKVSS